MVDREKSAGSIQPGLPIQRKVPLPPSDENLRVILCRALQRGNVRLTTHFQERCSERDISTVDAERLIETGDLVAAPVYEEDYHSFRCEFRGRIDGKAWKLVVALDCDSDFCWAPRIILVTIHRSEMKRSKKK